MHGIQPTEDAYWNDDVFWKSIRNTMVMDFFSAYAITFIALLIAIGTNHTGKIYIVIRTLFWATGGVGVEALSIIMVQIFNTYGGITSNFLNFFGFKNFQFLNMNGSRFVVILRPFGGH